METQVILSPWPDVAILRRVLKAMFPMACGLLAFSSAARAQAARLSPVLRIEAGALDPDDPLHVTMSAGATLGFQHHSQVFALRVVVQSVGRNYGTDLDRNARRFILGIWEVAGSPSGPRRRQVYLRLGAGAVLRHIYQTAPVGEAAIGLRYHMGKRWSLLGSAGDAVAWLPQQSFASCPTGYPGAGPCTVAARTQHNIGFAMALEFRP